MPNPQMDEEMRQAISIKCRERNGVEYFIEFESAVKLIVLERNSSDDASYHVTQDMVNDHLLDGFTIKTYRAVYVINGEDFAFDE
jgi:hypothetical protein